jgi:hypothetical protein
MSTDSDTLLQTAFAGPIEKLSSVTALVLLCGAAFYAAYLLGTDEESQPTGERSPQQPLKDTTEPRPSGNKASEPAPGDTTESQSAETKHSETAPKNTTKSRSTKNKLSGRAREM